MKTIVSILLMSVILFSCKKDPLPYTIKNLENNKIHAIGHGGYGNKSLTPMNTKESIMKAIDYRPYGIEMDIQITSDGVPVLFHDELLEHSTEGARGKVNSNKYVDLKENKYKSLNKELIRSLSEIIQDTKHYPLGVYVLDCKLYSDIPSTTYITTYAENLYKTIINLDIKNRVFIECPSPLLIQAFQKIDKDLKLFSYNSEFEKAYGNAMQYGVYGITIDMDLISREQVDLCHKNNIRVAIFDADTEHRNHLAMTLSPDFIQTDMVKDLTKRLFNLQD